MSQVKEFELLHGVVLTKILRSNSPTLRLVETDTKKAWAAYTINDEVTIYVKYSLTTRETQRESKTVWSFPLQLSELEKIKELRQNQPVYLVLVCGLSDISEAKNMQVCFLYPEQIETCVDLDSSKNQTISVEMKTRESLRAYGPKNSNEKNKLVISRNRLDKFEVPGS